ncbi:DUF2637 domain-containing protein [Streptomyces abikoensis]|uniref:DUF2637 domain-containing protein n=1 Tax=Streptomyces abikoensis TaxID=97398 RepID=UPI0033C2BF64
MTTPDKKHPQDNRPGAWAHAILVGVVALGAAAIAGIGFIGSYKAVQQLAEDKGFGTFARLYPIGVDAGIVVLLALDLLLSRVRMPFPLLRQTAWLLTGATIAFNAAAAWPDALAVAMHAVIPMLFVVVVEAGRHAVGRYAAITAGKHMDSIRRSRWFLAPWPTFKLWRRMKLYELRDYDKVIGQERGRLVYETRLEMRYGPDWQHQAPAEDLLPLKLVRFGVPLPDEDDESRAVLLSGPPGPSAAPKEALPASPPGEKHDVAADKPLTSNEEQEGIPSRSLAGPEPPDPAPPADPAVPVRPPVVPPLDGRAAVQAAYDALPEPDRTTTSARKLAKELAPGLGLQENTVRVYINELRRPGPAPVAEPSLGDSEPDPAEQEAVTV